MAVGSGLGGSFSFGVESVFNTSVAPSRSIEVASCDLKKNKRPVQGGGLANGLLVDRATRRRQPTRDANGSVTFEVTSQLMGLLLSHALGSSSTPTQIGTSPVYQQSYPLADNFGKSLTVQMLLPARGGTLYPYIYSGVKISAVEFTCEQSGLLMCTLEFDACDVNEPANPATFTNPVYGTNLLPYHFGQGSVGIAATGGTAVGSEPLVSSVKKASLRIERPMAVEDFFFGGGGLKAQPVMNGKVQVTGSLDVAFATKADFHDRFRDDSSFQFFWSFTGQTRGASADAIQFSARSCFLEGDSPTLDGPDEVVTSMPFTVLSPDDGSAAVSVNYNSLDIAA